MKGDSPPVIIDKVKQSLDAYIKIKEAKLTGEALKKLAGFKKLSDALGVAGAFVGFVFSFFGEGTGPDPEIIKLQKMIGETQTLITIGN